MYTVRTAFTKNYSIIPYLFMTLMPSQINSLHALVSFYHPVDKV